MSTVSANMIHDELDKGAVILPKERYENITNAFIAQESGLISADRGASLLWLTGSHFKE